MHPGYTTIVLGMGSQTFHPSRSRMLLKSKRSMTMHLCYITIVWALVVERFILIIYVFTKSASLLCNHCLGIETQTFHPSRSRMLLKRKRSMTMHLCYIIIVWALVVKRFIPILYFNRRKEV